MPDSLKPGCLYVVATPIGHRSDMSPRAIDTLSQVDWILCEDTRHSRPLLKHFGIDKPTHALHRFNERSRLSWVVERLHAGECGALVSDAGTPGIQDPGQHLLQHVWEQGCQLCPIPGPCAAIAALSIAGFVHEQFTFVGFLPAKTGARRARILALKSGTGPIIIYESAKRLQACLQDLADVLGPYPILLAREITKQYEQFWRTDLHTAANTCQDHWPLKGELALVIDRPAVSDGGLSEAQRAVLKTLLTHHSVKEASDMVATLSGVARNACYQVALTLK